MDPERAVRIEPIELQLGPTGAVQKESVSRGLREHRQLVGGVGAERGRSEARRSELAVVTGDESVDRFKMCRPRFVVADDAVRVVGEGARADPIQRRVYHRLTW